METQTQSKCKIHKEKQIELLCMKCKEVICLKCLVEHHNGHEVSMVEEKLNQVKTTLDTLTDKVSNNRMHCCEKLNGIKLKSEILSKEINDIETSVDKRFREIVDVLENLKQKLKMELESAKLFKLKPLEDDKNKLEQFSSEFHDVLIKLNDLRDNGLTVHTVHQDELLISEAEETVRRISDEYCLETTEVKKISFVPSVVNIDKLLTIHNVFGKIKTDDDNNHVTIGPKPTVIKGQYGTETGTCHDVIENSSKKASKTDNTEEKVLRAPIICLMGTSNSGKSTLLNKLAEKIGQSETPESVNLPSQRIKTMFVTADMIRDQTRMCKQFMKKELNLPGLLLIDTPGNECFSETRYRFLTACDIVILIIDILVGVDAVTVELINIMKRLKVPCIAAFNKIDRIKQWQTSPQSNVADTLKKQKQPTRMEIEEQMKVIIAQFHEQSLIATLFSDNEQLREHISIVPVSAVTGDGIGDLMALVCDHSQRFLCKRLTASKNLKATIVDGSTMSGHGNTFDIILIDGNLQTDTEIIIVGHDTSVVTKIRSILAANSENAGHFVHAKEMSAVQFYKITINGLDDTLFKSARFVTDDTDEAETRHGIFSVIPQSTIDLQSCGTFIQAHSWNCLHALYSMCKTNNIPVAGSNIGPIHNNDVSKAKVMMSRDPRYACILAVDVKVEQEARDMAKQNGVRIIDADTYSDLLVKYSQFQENYNKKKKEEFKQQAIFPCKLRILETSIYHKKDPLLFGVLVESGRVKVGTPLCIPDKDFLDIGKIASIEVDNIGVDCGETGQQVCIKIIARNDADKSISYGRHFNQTNELISKITEESVNVMKKWFRDEMSDTDYQLMMELKKTLAIV